MIGVHKMAAMPVAVERQLKGLERLMITVTRLNGKRFVVNAEMIRTVESNPDTTITLMNGDHLIVLEPMDRIVELAIEYGRLLRRMIPPS